MSFDPESVISSELGLSLYLDIPEEARARFEDEQGSLLTWIDAIYRELQGAYDIVRDTDEGPGFSTLMDIDRQDDPGIIRWLGQFVGARFAVGVDVTSMKNDLRAGVPLRRGTPTAMIREISKVLSGTKSVILQERYGGDAYYFRVNILQSERPATDIAGTTTLVSDAIKRQKPVGLTFDVFYLTGADYATAQAASSTYTIAMGKHATYDHAMSNPGL